MDTPPIHGHSVFREAHLRDYWKIIWQGRWTLLAVFIVVVGATGVWTFLQTPIFRATATVEVQPQARRAIGGGNLDGLGAAGYGWFAEEKYHNTQVEIIRSRDVAERAVRNLGLSGHPFFAEATDPVELFRRMIQVDPRRDTGLLEISISGEDRKEITQWANGVAQAYVDRNYEKARANIDKAAEAIREQLDSLEDDLTEAEEERLRTLEDQDVRASEEQTEILTEKLRLFNGELSNVTIEVNQLADQLSQIERMRASGADLMSFGELARDTSLQELQTQKVGLQRELDGLKVELRPGHPDYEQKLKELDSVQSRIDDKIRLLIDDLRTRHALARDKQQFLRQNVADIDELALRMAKERSRYEIVATDADMKKQVFDLMSKTINEVILQSELMNNNVQLLDDATPPLFPIKPRKKLNLAVGAMFGFFLGLAAVFFLDYLDNTIRTPEDVEKYLGLSVIGVVPKMADHGLTQRAIKEAYQSLRTSIIFSSKNRERKVILTTSTGPREGKSSTVSNLARTLAAAGDRVVVIDCDLRRPRQHAHYNLEREPGLTNYLAAPASEHDWASYGKTVGPLNLHVLTSGPIPPSPPELLGSSRFSELLDTLREQYDWILIDSPPAANLADASVLATLADMIVLVVHHNQTDRDHVIKTVQQVRAVNANFAGVVLNNVDLERAYHKDYYYAGYYYEEDEKGTRSKKRVERKAQVG